MSELNFFQTYSQNENHLTNNTLLMMRHVYRVSPLLFERLLQSLLNSDIAAIGPQF